MGTGRFIRPVRFFICHMGSVVPLRDPQAGPSRNDAVAPGGPPGLLRAAPPCSSQGRPTGACRVRRDAPQGGF